MNVLRTVANKKSSLILVCFSVLDVLVVLVCFRSWFWRDHFNLELTVFYFLIGCGSLAISRIPWKIPPNPKIVRFVVVLLLVRFGVVAFSGLLFERYVSGMRILTFKKMYSLESDVIRFWCTEEKAVITLGDIPGGSEIYQDPWGEPLKLRVNSGTGRYVISSKHFPEMETKISGRIPCPTQKPNPG